MVHGGQLVLVEDNLEAERMEKEEDGYENEEGDDEKDGVELNGSSYNPDLRPFDCGKSNNAEDTQLEAEEIFLVRNFRP